MIALNTYLLIGLIVMTAWAGLYREYCRAEPPPFTFVITAAIWPVVVILLVDDTKPKCTPP